MICLCVLLYGRFFSAATECGLPLLLLLLFGVGGWGGDSDWWAPGRQQVVLNSGYFIWSPAGSYQS